MLGCSVALSSSSLLSIKSGLLPAVPTEAPVLRRKFGWGGEVPPCVVDFFLESHAKGLDSFREIAADPCDLGGGGAPQGTVEDDTELGIVVEARLGI